MDAGRERDLVERCRRGDEGAFQELVDEHRSLVFALIARVIPDRSRTEDAAQDVFLRMYRGASVLSG
jgi:RNA polymerase sigma-70 factor (ECF subfamily)